MGHETEHAAMVRGGEQRFRGLAGWVRVHRNVPGLVLLSLHLRLSFCFDRACFLRLNGILPMGPALCAAGWGCLNKANLEHI